MNWFSTYHVHHRVAARFRAGRAFLLGDAAHVHSPVGGQGMNTGIGDAVNLAWKLAAVLNGGAPDRLLATYEQERIGFARRLVATTDRAFTVVTKQGRVARWVRTRLVPLIAPLLFRLAPVRRFLFRTVSQINVNYRNSPLSEGAAGGVRGGDRLPWVSTGPGTDNFAPLASLTWQVHVYGEPRPGLADVCAELRASPAPFRVAVGHAARRSPARGALSRQAGRLRRARGAGRRPRAVARVCCYAHNVVLFLLLGAHLIPGCAFSVTGPWPPGTPIHFTLSMAPRRRSCGTITGHPGYHHCGAGRRLAFRAPLVGLGLAGGKVTAHTALGVIQGRTSCFMEHHQSVCGHGKECYED